MADNPSINRAERRKIQTRAALVQAAQSLLAAGKTDVAILEITQVADVGAGSFYNHFSSKSELFGVAVSAMLETHARTLDQLAAPLDDPAEVFVQGFRLTGRLFRRRPDVGQVMLNPGLSLIAADPALAPRALRDITAAARAGRFTINDPDLAMATAAGALLGLGQLLRDQPDRDDATSTDWVAEGLLCMFGLPAEDASRLCRRPLPDTD